MTASQDNLLDRYLHAVQFWLPRAQRHDIIAELAEDLHSQIAEREAANGRPLSEDELVAVLKKRGAPMRVAAGYLPEQRLINPAMLPAYRLVLKIALLWVLLPLLVIVFAGTWFASGHPERALLQFWAEGWRNGFTVVGIVTILFALLDRYQVKGTSRDWNPRKLPRVPRDPEISARWNHLAGFIFGMIAAIFWVYWLGQRTALTFPGGLRITFDPVWKYVYWPILVVTITSASTDLLAFLYPCWAPTRSRVRIALDAMLLVAVAVLFQAGHWAEITAPNLSPHDLPVVVQWFNLSVQVTLIAVALTIGFDAFLELRRLLRPARLAQTFERTGTVAE